MKNKLQIYREEAVRYLAREKDEEALLDFITKSFVFNESDTEQELEEAELAVEEDKEGLDIEEEEEEDEDGEEFVAKVGGTFSIFYPTGGGICMLWHKSTTLVLTHFFLNPID